MPDLTYKSVFVPATYNPEKYYKKYGKQINGDQLARDIQERVNGFSTDGYDLVDCQTFDSHMYAGIGGMTFTPGAILIFKKIVDDAI